MYKNFSKVYDKYIEVFQHEEWVQLLEEIIKRNQVSSHSILDLGCGTGETLQELCKKYNCSGLDISKDMLKKANIKLKNKNIALYLGDMREFSTGAKYDVIFSFFDTVNHLTSMEDLLDTLNSVKASLNKGGIYVFDVIDREFIDNMFSNGVFADTRKDFALIWEHEYEEETELDIIDATYFIKNKDKTYEKYTETYEKKIFSQKEIEQVCKICSLRIEEIIMNDELAGKRYFYVLKNI